MNKENVGLRRFLHVFFFSENCYQNNCDERTIDCV